MRLEFLQAGEIVTTHGVRGEMKVLPWVDSPDFLVDFDRVRIDGKAYCVESCRIQKTCNLLKLKGVDRVEDVLIGKVMDVLDYPGNKVYVVKGDYTYMIPAVKAFVISTDIDANRMEVKTIEGMRTDEG